jgi:hypothetical protein
MSENEEDGLKSIVKAGAGAVIELAKAGQEQQKTYQAAIDLVRRVGGYLGGVFGPASHELSLLFGEQMKFWRFKNAANILEKTEAIIRERGLRPDQIKALGFGEGLLLLDAASQEEDETVQALWARLMANSIDPVAVAKPEKVYIDLLKSISGREAVFLDLVDQIEQKGASFKSREAIDTFEKDMVARAESKWRKFTSDERAISLQNLVRLRCLSVRPSPIDAHNLFARVPDTRPGSTGVMHLGSGSRWAVVDPEKFNKVLQEIVERQMIASGMADFKQHSSYSIPMRATFNYASRKIDLPEANFMLTPLGKGLMRACREVLVVAEKT